VNYFFPTLCIRFCQQSITGSESLESDLTEKKVVTLAMGYFDLMFDPSCLLMIACDTRIDDQVIVTSYVMYTMQDTERCSVQVVNLQVLLVLEAQSG
jgi:hypothetical protein